MPGRISGKMTGLVCVLLAFAVSGLESKMPRLGDYLHPKAQLGSPPAVELFEGIRPPISPRAACKLALRHLLSKGVKRIVICETHWIAAPLSGYLIDAKGEWSREGRTYTLFRIGVEDGSGPVTQPSAAGREFVFIARGPGEGGKASWHPAPGPDYRVREGETVSEGMLAYEFLLYHRRFEAIPRHYR